MFAYCGNNPVSRTDNGGEWWHIVAGAAIGAVASVVTEGVINNEEFTFNDAISVAAGGAVTGALQTVGVSPVLASSAGTAVSTIVSGIQNGDDAKTIAINTSLETLKTAASGVILATPGKIAKSYVGGKYVKLNRVEKYIARVVHEPKYLNEQAISTIVADNVVDSIKTMAREWAKNTIK